MKSPLRFSIHGSNFFFSNPLQDNEQPNRSLKTERILIEHKEQIPESLNEKTTTTGRENGKTTHTKFIIISSHYQKPVGNSNGGGIPRTPFTH